MANVLTEIKNGIATVTLNKPDVHNAFDDHLIAELTAQFKAVGADDKVRVVIIAANGKSFSAGGDLGWMQRMANYSLPENREDAKKLALLMHTLNFLPKPTIAKVHGSAFGGGVGLVACADIAICAEEAQFSLSEARLGLIPAVISPYVIAAMGERAARRYFLTAERFGANDAVHYGLVHQKVKAADLDKSIDYIIEKLLECGPVAQMECKKLINAVKGKPIDRDMIDFSAETIATIRASAEGREGVAAFLEKRAPNWMGKK